MARTTPNATPERTFINESHRMIGISTVLLIWAVTSQKVEMDVLLKVAKDALKDETIQKWETFMNEHESKFEDVAEHKLEYTEIYNQFTAMVEGDLSDIVKAHGSTVEDFFALCRESQEDANAQAFVALLVDSMDYTPFADIMKNREKRHYYFSILKMWRKSLA